MPLAILTSRFDNPVRASTVPRRTRPPLEASVIKAVRKRNDILYDTRLTHTKRLAAEVSMQMLKNVLFTFW